MNKLTAELLHQLKSAAQEEIMCREASDTSDVWQDLASPENILTMIEIALPLLEQQESLTDTYRQIENDDWIEWGGTDRCPVEAGATVIVRLTNPRDTLQAKAGEFEWSSDKANDPITAYRVIENDGRG